MPAAIIPFGGRPVAGFIFGAFHLDSTNGELRRGGRPIKITGQLWSVLRCLLEKPGELIAADALATAAWAEGAASSETVGRTIRRLRSILGDTSSPPLYIESVHGRGYRFVAPVTYVPDDATAHAKAFVGRDRELLLLRRLLAQSLASSVRVALVLGDAGMGKTTLLDRFARDPGPAPDLRIGRTVCLDAGPDPEPYGALLSVLQAWLASGEEGLAELLATTAPTWAAELGLQTQPFDRQQMGSSQRMPREGVALFGALARQRPTLIFLDDVHWADSGTISVVDALSRGRDHAPLLIVCAARPHELSIRGCPAGILAGASVDAARVVSIDMSPLSPEAITTLLEAHGVVGAASPRLRRALHSLSGGHPLLACCLIDDWNDRGLIDGIAAGHLEPDIATALAPSRAQAVQHLIEHRLELLDERTVQALEAAALAGHRFDVREVVAATGDGCAEDGLFDLARRNFLIESGEVETWPDGTSARTYAFRHALLRAPLRDRIPPARRAQWQRLVCERLESGYLDDPSPVLMRLLAHAHELGDLVRILKYEVAAARTAARRLSFVAAADRLEQALAAAARLPESPSLRATKAVLIMRSAAARFFGVGATDTRIEALTAQACALGAEVGDHRTTFQSHMINAGYLMRRGRVAESFADCERLVAIAEEHEPTLRSAAYCFHGLAEGISGRFVQASALLERALALPKDAEIPADVNVERMSATYQGLVLTARGYLQQAQECFERGARVAQSEGNLVDVIDLAHNRMIEAVRREDRESAAAWSGRVLAIDTEHGFPSYVTGASIVRDWARVRMAPAVADKMRTLQLRRRASGEAWDDVVYSLLCADAWLRAGDVDQALQINEDAITSAERNGDRCFLSDVWRQRARIFVHRGGGGMRDARTMLRSAMSIAHEQDAALPEWLAAQALARCGPLRSEDERSIERARGRIEWRREQLSNSATSPAPDVRTVTTAR